MVAGTVLFALGLKTTLGGVGEELDTVPRVRAVRRRRAVPGRARRVPLPNDGSHLPATHDRALVLVALFPVALAIPALPALALVSAVCSLIVAYEVIRYREHRVRVRHPEVAA
jgi:hypothetical protein